MSLKVTIIDNNLLVVMIYNYPLYITSNFDIFKMIRMFVELGESIIIMSLNTLTYLRISTSQLKVHKMLLKGFNQLGERALGFIALAFEIKG